MNNRELHSCSEEPTSFVSLMPSQNPKFQQNLRLVIRRFIRAWRLPPHRARLTRSLGQIGLAFFFVALAVTLHELGAEAIPLAFQSSPIQPTNSPTPVPTFDPGGFPTATPTFDPNLFPTATPFSDPNFSSTPTSGQGITTVTIPDPSGNLTDSYSTLLEPPPGEMPDVPDAMPLLPKPEAGNVAAPGPKATDPAAEARLFGQTVVAALTYVWMGCGLMLLLLAGATFLWLHRRSKLR